MTSVEACTCVHLFHTVQELLDGFQETQVAYLDLSLYPTAALQSAGPGSCVAGVLKLMPGMFGTPSQVLGPHLSSIWRAPNAT